MKPTTFYVAGAALLLSLAQTQTEAQAIYKTVDADGNVTYTDQPPGPDAQPLDLPPITVADPYDASSAKTAGSGNDAVDELVPYADFRLLSPTQEQHFWGTGGTFTAQAASVQPLAQGHLVRFVLDGKVAGTSTGFFMEFTEIDRGEHQIFAEVVDTAGKSIARSENVVFFMRQQSIINQNRGRN